MVELPVDPFRDAPPPEVEAVRPGEAFDWPGIETYLRKHLPADIDLDGEFAVLQFPNGSANLTYMLRFGATELVFLRPPFGTLAPGAHDMKRRRGEVIRGVIPESMRQHSDVGRRIGFANSP